MRSIRIIAILLTLLAMQSASVALTAEVSVSAKITHRVAQVGTPMQLQIQVVGGEVDGRAPQISVDGLNIDFVGPSFSRRVEIVNGRMSNSVDTTYVYEVTAKREGEFTIPATDLAVNGKTYRTQPIALKVQKGDARSPDAAETMSFAEIDVARKSIYVGEVVPVEVRLYVKAGVVNELSQTIEINGEGFTVEKAPEPSQQVEMRDGVEYQVFTYRTVMTPSKAGKLSIGPTQVPFVAQVRRPVERRRGSFGGQVFDDFFGSFGGLSERRRFNETAPAVEVDVKPLPTEGRPKNFSGAVGHFSFQGEGSPTKVKAGDPITMRLKVTGTGNFDRMSAPAIEEGKGWQVYEGSEKFAPADQLKTTGTKTFEVPVIPDGPHRETPVFAFAFFDPNTGKYVTQRSKPQLLTIEGSAPAPEPVKPEIVSQPRPEAAKPEDKPITDLAGLQYDVGVVQAFSPLYARREFWLAQGVPALGVLGLLVARLLRRDPRRAQHAVLERQRASALKQLRSTDDPSEFWEHAARVVQFDTAAATGVEPGGVDPEVVQRVRKLDAETMAVVEEVFERRGALLFAGKSIVGNRLLPEQRDRVVAALERLCRQ